MNYTTEAIERKVDQFESTSQEIEKRVGVIVIRLLLIAFISVILIGGFGVLGILSGIVANTPDVASVNIAPSGYATFIYDSDGNQLQKLTTSNSNRISVSLDKVPVALQKAVIAVEDERFYLHNGIDAKGIVRAFVVGVRNRFRFTEGASTITQQLLKNNVFTNWTEESRVDSVKRKIQEQFLAVELEEKLEEELGSKQAAKDRILENYLNTINLGAGTYGVQAASRKYFGKDVESLTLSEATVIAGITQNPSRYNPIRQPEKNAERRIKILNDMVEQGYISQQSMDEALADPVYDRIANAQSTNEQVTTIYSYFVDELTEQVVSDLMRQKGYTENQAYQALYSGGLRIYTTQDMEIQAIMDEVYANPANFPEGTKYSLDWALSVANSEGEVTNYSHEMLRNFYRENLDPSFSILAFESEEQARNFVSDYKSHVVNEEAGDVIIAERFSCAPEPQSSMVLMDQKTGYVKGLIGGRGEKTASLTLNRATNSTRQPGSTFKILSTYSYALDSGMKTLASTYLDDEITYEDGTPVSNSNNTYTHDMMNIRDAIINSVNTIAVQTITDITPKAAYNQLLKYGFTTLSERNDVYQPLALGGIYNGVTNLELTAAFAAIANEGNYTKPIFYTRIEDQDGNIVINNTPETTRAISRETAALLTNAMEDVVTKGTGQNVRLDCGMPVAGKTGTTTDYRDVWFVGYTPYYTCGVWAGYDDSENLPDEGIYHVYHQILWKSVMDRISRNQSKIQFLLPNTITHVEVCSQTGLIPRGSCPSHWEYFAPGTAPTETCGGWRVHSRYYEEEEEEDWNRWDYDWDDEEEEETETGQQDQENQNNQQNHSDQGNNENQEGNNQHTDENNNGGGEEQSEDNGGGGNDEGYDEDEGDY